MKKLWLFSLLALSAGPGVAQQIGGSFDGKWEACTPYLGAGVYHTDSVGQQPVGWKASNIYQLMNFELVKQDTIEEGNYAVAISNKFTGLGTMGQNAPGYLSIGTPWNAARVVSIFPYQATETDGGSFGGAAFVYRPDSVKFTFKRTHGTEKPEEVATVAAMLWKGTFTSTVGVGINMTNESPAKEVMTDRDRDVMGLITEGVTKSEDAECIATLNHKIEGNYADWTTLSLPLTYQSEAVPEKINLIFSSSDYFNDDRAAIGAGNSLTIDDVELVYNSQLATLTYDGETVPGFAVDNYEVLDLSSVDFEESQLAFTSNGAGATVETSYDAVTARLTLTVKGNDYEVNSDNVHTYKVQFKLADSYQLMNGSFDGSWETCTPYQGAGVYYTAGTGEQPVGWKSSNINQILNFELVERDTVDAGNYAVAISNMFTGLGTMGQNAPGYLSIGTPWNAARVVSMFPYQATETDGGSFGGATFAARPDSVKFTFKRTHGTDKPEEVATVAAMLWKGTFTSTVGVGINMANESPAKEVMTDRDRDVMGLITEGVTKSENAECIATLNHKIEGDYAEWTTLSLPLTYQSDAVPEKINLIFSSSDYFNDDRAAIGAGNSLTIDDVELVYNSQLATLTYDGETVPGFAVDNYEVLDLSSVDFEESQLAFTSNGAGATVETSYDAVTARLTLTVKGNDYEVNSDNVHTYKVQFKLADSYQLMNGSFDGSWETCTPYQGAGMYYTAGTGEQPVGWKSSNINQILNFELVERDTVDAGNYAVAISNMFTGLGTMGQNAPGYLSIGTPWNAARVVSMFPYQATETDGGSFGGAAFAARPDSVKFTFKRTHGTDKPEEVATVAAMLWKGTFTSTVGVGINMANESPAKEVMTDRDRDVMGLITEGVTKSENAECIATLNHKIEGDYAEWTTLSLPLTYQSDAVPEKINLIFSSSDYFNDDRAAIGAGNSLTIDDVELVYNSQLATLTYDGETVPGFAVDNYEVLDLSSVDFEESKLAYTSNGAGATVETSYDKEKAVLTLTVKGNDYEVNSENEHIYKVQFKLPVPVGIDGVEAGQHNGTAYDLQGRPTSKDSKGILIINGKKVMKK